MSYTLGFDFDSVLAFLPLLNTGTMAGFLCRHLLLVPVLAFIFSPNSSTYTIVGRFHLAGVYTGVQNAIRLRYLYCYLTLMLVQFSVGLVSLVLVPDFKVSPKRGHEYWLSYCDLTLVPMLAFHTIT